MTEIVSPRTVLTTTQDLLEERHILGSYIPRIDGYERVTGRAKYTGDWKFPNMLYAKIIQSSIPHGLVKKIDTSKALEISGVEGIITCKEDNTIWSNGEREHKRRVFTDHVRFIGDCIGAVAASSRRVAQQAAEAVEVEYEEFPGVFSIEGAMKIDAPKIWDEGNFLPQMKYGFGDINASFTKADLAFEQDYSTSRVHNSPLETGVSIAWWEGNRLTVIASAQGVHTCREGIAQDLKLPLESVRVITLYKGGGFGNKANSLIYDHISALLAKKTKRPVMTEYSREQDFVGVHGRWSSNQHLKVAVEKNQAKILAVDLKGYSDIGAYNRAVKTVKLMDGAENYYSCEAWNAEIFGVYTNSPTTAHMRAPAGPQANFACETMVDELAHQLNIDPYEFRLRNCIEKYHAKYDFLNNTMRDCLEAGAERFHWTERWTRPSVDSGDGIRKKMIKRRGVGVAMGNFHAYVGKGEALLKLKKNGSLELYVGVVDIGTGAKTTMAVIAAETLGIPLDDIRVIWGDTDTCPFSVGESGSRTTSFTGTAVKTAALNLKKKLLGLVSGYYGLNQNELEIRSGHIFRHYSSDSAGRKMLRALTPTEMSIGIGKFLGLLGHDELTEHQLTEPSIPEHTERYSFAAHFAEVEVDTETGQVSVVSYTAAHDSGLIVNRLTAESQIQGSVVMGIGMALSENLLIDSNFGNIQNPSFMTYRLPNHVSIPKISCVFVESNDPYGPKSIGEVGLVPVPAAIGNAIFNATGIRLRKLPFSPPGLIQ
ncbi:MAG: xanthine dehydrogenase family protein molybdopterin-binding subunit [Nitrososphaerota archaeon]|nr:xanthine dehydrogenase family protein molybdopterin-binding subunit [Nitrososphaerota archaeon]MDG6922317.1 xanthine dehydrogenase family protein molybdopterin-binding subunit [Nitrososphaerota archaeon]